MARGRQTGRLVLATALGAGAAALALVRRGRPAQGPDPRELVLEARRERMRAARRELTAAHDGDRPA
jgi:hypothetical protein